MYATILLAAALQDWERYSTHALAAREVAATLAQGASHQLHVLSVYDYPPVDTSDLPTAIAIRHREDLLRRTDTLMVEKLDAYVAPLHAEGVAVSPILRVGDSGDVIVEVAINLKADVLILGSHSKRSLLEWRFLGLKQLLPSVRGLAAVGPAGGDTVSGVACTRAARSGPAGCPRGDWRSH
jgi:nucleotide-binding universal stress UspA family protein